MNILISAGHTSSGKGTGAVGYINESKENRELGKLVVEHLKKLGCKVDYHEVNSGSNYISQQVSKANSKSYDLAVQIHFNSSSNPQANGTEVVYRSSKGKIYAQQVQDKLKTIFKDRKIKHDLNDLKRDLGWLRNTKPTSILIEACFVSSKLDTDIYNSNKNKIAKLIAEGIIGKSTPATSTNTSKPLSSTKVPYVVRVVTDVLNIRKGAGTNFDKVGQLKKGSAYTIVEESNGWGLLKSYQSGRNGWISLNSKYVEKK